LKTGGELELIDDEIFFPYGAFPVITPPPSPRSPEHRTSSGEKYSRSANVTGETNSDTSSPTLRGSEIADSDCTLIDEVAIKPKPESHLATVGCQRRSMAYLQRWATNRQVAQDVEETFTNMLRKRFIHPSPKDFVPDLLRYIFGSGNVGNTQTYNIKLAPASFTHSHRVDPPSKNTLVSGSAHSDKDPSGCSEENSPVDLLGSGEGSPIRETSHVFQSAKAAGRLGISYSDLIAATASARRPAAQGAPSFQYSTTPRCLQSPGIIVAPSTFIPLTATETEFHACKWIHTVLGCRPAIFDYVRSHVDEAGRRLVSDAELKDALWTYEW
jgi:hypothetical protein